MAKTKMDMIMEMLEDIKAEQKAQREDIEALKAAVNSKKETKNSTKGGNTKGGKKQTAGTAEKPAKTKKEAIKEWAENKFSDEERAQFGKDAKKVREKLMKKNEKIGKGNEGYLYGKAWKDEFNKEWKKLGYSTKFYK